VKTMKKTLGLFMMTYSLLTWGQQGSPQQVQQSSRQAACKKELARASIAGGATDTATLTPITSARTACQSLKLAAFLSDKDLETQRENVGSSDGKIQCVLKAGYTIDYADCAKSVRLYNGVLLAEQAMMAQQKVRLDMKNKQIQQDAQNQAAQGDAQGAAFDAAQKTNDNLATLNKEQAAVYAAAVGALSAAVGGWQGKSSNALRNYCSVNKLKFSKSDVKVNDIPDCATAMDQAKSKASDEMFANDMAKSQLVAATIDFVNKGVAAGIRGMQNQKASQLLNNLPEDSVTDQTVLMDPCAVNPMAAECTNSGTLTPGQSYSPGDFTFGSGGTNAFDSGSTASDEFGDPGAAGTIPDANQLADVNSPFVDEAKKANGILDPAAAANVQAGNQASAPGGGGGGGGGAGGASLGDDLQGAAADENKEADIKSGKHKASYASGTGSELGAIKNSKEDANPFASLFDAKSAGGIEEDRSIASEDIGAMDSGLFQKISKRYGQVQADKRIEALNLE
jgi:hypothetical protein